MAEAEVRRRAEGLLNEAFLQNWVSERGNTTEM